MKIKNLLGRLEKVKKTGSGWTARCRAHDDKQSSLSIGHGQNGGIVVKCFAGCTADAIMTACGLELSDLMPEDIQSRQIETVYSVTLEDGSTVEHIRYDNPDGTKKFSWRRNGQTGLGGVKIADLPLYRPNGQPQEGPVVICYTGDTELLTEKGWSRFDEIDKSLKVAQWSIDDESIKFTKPNRWVSFHTDSDLVNIKSQFSDLMITQNHRQPVKGIGAPYVRKASDLFVNNLKYPVSGEYHGCAIPPCETIIRLMVAISADGHYEKNAAIIFNFKKSRKIDRIKYLLSKLGIDITSELNFKSCPEWTYLRVNAESLKCVTHNLNGKDFKWEMIHWPIWAKKIALDEMQYWDGDRCSSSIRLFTSSKNNADIACAMAILSGRSSNVREDARRGRINYVVNVRSEKKWMTPAKKPIFIEHTGVVYCCSVDSGFLVTRRNGKVTISGNCEGEKSAIAACRLGLRAYGTMSGANGCPSVKSLKSICDGLPVILWADNDEPGSLHMSKIKSIVGHFAQSCVMVQTGGPKDDASDFRGTKDEFLNLANKPEPTKTRRLSSGVGAAMASMVRFSIGDHSDRVPFGIRKIDRACRGGMKRGAMYLLGAETGGGKTTFLQGVAVETAKKGTVLLVSPEMDIDELAEREIMRQSGYSIFDIGPWVRPDQKVAAEKALKEAADRIIRENMNVEIMEDIEATMSEIAIEAKKIKNLRLVIIDYAQEIADMDSKLARYLAVGEVGKDAIKLGRACNCPVLIASQVNKTKTTGGRTEYEFRESKKLSHKANTTMIIEVERFETPNDAGFFDVTSSKIFSLKNRGGPRFTVDLDYKPSIYRMTNLDVKNIEHQDNWQDTGDY